MIRKAAALKTPYAPSPSPGTCSICCSCRCGDRYAARNRLVARPQPLVIVSVGDPMPRITLPSASGSLFDSRDPTTSGLARAYWLGAPPTASAAARLADTLAACETLLHRCSGGAGGPGHPSWLLDRAGEVGGVSERSGRLRSSSIRRPHGGAARHRLPMASRLATRLFGEHPRRGAGQAPVLLLGRVVRTCAKR